MEGIDLLETRYLFASFLEHIVISSTQFRYTLIPDSSRPCDLIECRFWILGVPEILILCLTFVFVK